MVGEWRALEWRDLKLDDTPPTVTVQRRRTKDGETLPETKNRKPRRVPLVERVLDRVGYHPRTFDSKLVFPNTAGGYVHPSNFIRRIWEPAFTAAELPYRPPNTLRHTFATRAIAAGVDTFTLAQTMGTSVRMIDQTYGHLRDTATPPCWPGSPASANQMCPKCARRE